VGLGLPTASYVKAEVALSVLSDLISGELAEVDACIAPQDIGEPAIVGYGQRLGLNFQAEFYPYHKMGSS
jgi:hypothetical protein